MGSKNSKQASGIWGLAPSNKEGRQRKWYWRLLPEQQEKWWPSPDGSDRALKLSSTRLLEHDEDEETFVDAEEIIQSSPALDPQHPRIHQYVVDHDDEEEVGFPVRPRRPLHAPTYKDMIDMSHFLKEKGGLQDIFYSPRRHAILDLYAQNEHGFITGWQTYTDGPGIRYPLEFGFLWKLVPVTIEEEYDNKEENCLLHDRYEGQQADPWRETLVWRFDPELAWCYKAGHKKLQTSQHNNYCQRAKPRK
uniref:Protein Nef n=1 Tax=Simian immunodeficiency virus TaxID=11723 RepID=Q70IG6_SIV|nr:nef protein [Simian immunodeficiency virus]